MRLFSALTIATIALLAATFALDLIQPALRKNPLTIRIVYDAATKKIRFQRPVERITIIYASLYGPGEPVMRVEDELIDQFEVDYSQRLSAGIEQSLTEQERQSILGDGLDWIQRNAAPLREKLRMLDLQPQQGDGNQQSNIIRALRGENVVRIINAPQSQLPAREALQAMLALNDNSTAARPADSEKCVEVKVERRWQGRWVLSANRPRFLTGNDVPDIIASSKMELTALVNDGYAVALDQPLGEGPAPLDSPDTWENPSRKWKEAFLPQMLEEARYQTSNPATSGHIYIAPVFCTTWCLFYNKEIFRQQKLSAPRTWPEFLDVCAKLKASGVIPLTADQISYADAWMTLLINRSIGQSTFEKTLCGVPQGRPIAERQSEPPWNSRCYRDIFHAIRNLHEQGYFDKDFKALTWPSAQRAFVAGKAAMMINGSWLPQELSGYGSESKSFELGCFAFPAWPGAREEDQNSFSISVFGPMVCRQGKATPHAIELVKYLGTRTQQQLTAKNGLISCMSVANFPSALSELEDGFKKASTLSGRGPQVYAARFNSAVVRPRYEKFFLGETSVDEFLQTMEQETDNYLRKGGEAGYE